MKRALLALACLLPMMGSAMAGTLPVHGVYCGDAEMRVDRTGVFFEDGSCPAIDQTTIDCREEGEESAFPVRITLKEDRRAGTLTYTEAGEDPIVLKRCP